jgi:hypothetical protein
MFIGQFAVGFAATKFAPRTSAAVLLAAPLFLDLLWPVFLLLGWEHVRIDPGNTRYTPLDLWDYPWSHSLLMSVVWATVFALAYHFIAHYLPGTVAIWIGVVSHWVLDWITHRPDMPLYPAAARASALDSGIRFPEPRLRKLRCSPSASGSTFAPPAPAIASDATRLQPMSDCCRCSMSATASVDLRPAWQPSPGRASPPR